jgi:pyruvate/2-oxoglutarate dehydrogenase complex dihydrolipoamide dehydrogenase (E3) component/uncharacterized membrane protein YdjX (TVP38/TMEM64 family)
MKRVLPLGGLLVLLLIAWASGLFSELSWAGLAARRGQLGALVAAHPLSAPLLFVGAYATIVALSFPGAAAILTTAGGMLFGIWVGAAAACAGATLGAVMVFLAARCALAGFFASRAGPWLNRFRAGLAKDGFFYLLSLRLMPVFPFWLVNLAPALLGMRLAPFAAATAIGIVPGTLVFASIGAGFDGVIAAGGQPKLGFHLFLPLAGLGVLSLAPVIWRKWKDPNGSLAMARSDGTHFDLAVIGAGAAGLSVTAVAAQLGLRVALIERAQMGGECLNNGCVPSKALLAAAHVAQTARRAGRFGVRLGEPKIDWDGVRAHVQGAVAAIAPMDSEARFRALGATVLRGEARFVAPDTLAVNSGRIVARRIVIAAGSRPAIPPIPGLDGVPYLTNETLFAMPEKPSHLLILGGGPIGLEMAQAHAALGCRVSVVEAGSIAAKEDPELAAGLRVALTALGIALHENSQVIAVEVDAMQGGPVLVLTDKKRIVGSHLLVATGRRPNIEDLDLGKADVRAGRDGIATDRGLRSLTNRRVFAIGDIADPEGIGPRAFTHVGSYHAGIVIRRGLFRLPARIDYAALPRVTYTQPELAQVGMTEAEARKTGYHVSVLRWPLAENDRAVTEGESLGLVKLVVARNRVLGAGILAPHAGEMIGQWTLAISQRARLSALANMIMPYPTRAEIGKRAAGSYFAPSLFSARSKALVRLLFRLP